MFQKHKTETSAVTLSKVGEGSAGELAQGLSHTKTYALLPGLSLGFQYGQLVTRIMYPWKRKQLAAKIKGKESKFLCLQSNSEKLLKINLSS